MIPSLLHASTQVLLLLGGSLVLLPLALLFWLAFGREPRRRRAYRFAQRVLHEGAWEKALAGVREILQLGRLSPQWEGRVTNLQGECHHVAGEQALKDKRFEEALRHFTTAAELLRLATTEPRDRVVDAMLTEVLRLFAAGPASQEATCQLIDRLLTVQPSHAAGTFWQGLCHLRAGHTDPATEALTRAHVAGGKTFIDPSLYLGMIHLRQGKVQEALHCLAEANRVDANCPFVPLHLGLALVAAEGDGTLAVRALQRALGPRGLPLWQKTPQQAWVDGLPEEHSYIRRLARKYSYSCPLHGDQLISLIHQGQFALGQAQYRLGHFQEAADVFTALLQDAPPSAPVLRGLGLALVRLERYDQAYKHLRIALEQEPNDPCTAGYLALCGALGKPTEEGDKPRNVAWAVHQLAQWERHGDAEWAGLCSRVLAEARTLALPIAAEEQLRLCDSLASVFAIDPQAAAAYEHLAATAPEKVRSEHAWIYSWAALQHGLSGSCDLVLFGLTVREAEAARPFYQHRSWDFEAVEYAYLDRSAQARPGQFPENLGPYYADRGTGLLLNRAQRLEEAGDLNGAVASLEVLLRLASNHGAAHDRLARLCAQRGDVDRAIDLLTGWHNLEPANHLPLVRRAVLEQQRGNAAGCSEALRLALERTAGLLRSGIAFLGARLALASRRRILRTLSWRPQVSCRNVSRRSRDTSRHCGS